MPLETINGVRLFVEEYGAGEPLVLVHGSWTDHLEWPFVVPDLATRYRVAVYDRRGHTRSERVAGQGSVRDDVADLAAIIERTGERAHVLGNSFGASIALRLAAARPELLRTLNAHEPPLFDLLRGDPATQGLADELDRRLLPVVRDLEAGRMEEGARRFIDTVALGPGAWDGLPDDARRTLAGNAPTFLDECRDPEQLKIDLAALARVACPVLLSNGSESPPYFAPVLNRLAAVLPHARRRLFAGSGHIPHITHPADYVRAIQEFLDGAAP